jgi:hypothetical protein
MGPIHVLGFAAMVILDNRACGANCYQNGNQPWKSLIGKGRTGGI